MYRILTTLRGNRRSTISRAALALSLACAHASAASAASFENRAIAELEGLDKITARVWTFDVPVGHAIRFGTLEIVALACRETPPEERPESAAYLEVIDHRTDGDPVALFEGWMFASNPALSALQHPVYDVWVKDCK